MSYRRVTNRITSVRTVCLATTFDLPKSPATVQEHHIVHFASRFESGQQYCFLFTFIYLTPSSPIFRMLHRPTAKTHFSGCVFGGVSGIFFPVTNLTNKGHPMPRTDRPKHGSHISTTIPMDGLIDQMQFISSNSRFGVLLQVSY